jgi:hypothetical protein
VKVFALPTFLTIPVIVLLRASFQFGSLETGKCFFVFQALHSTNASSKKKPVEPFFTLCKNVSEGKRVVKKSQ